jgi:hypothetical protein
VKRKDTGRPPSFEVSLNEFRTRVNIDLAQHRLAGIHKSMRCVCGDHNNPTGFRFALFMTDRYGGTAFQHKNDFHVWMRMQRRTLSGLRSDDVGRDRRAFFFADEFVRHSLKRQLLEI